MSLEQIQAFLEATDEVQLEAANRGEVYTWISRTLCEQEYWKQSKATKGFIAALFGKDDGPEPGTGDTLYRRLRGNGQGGRAPVPASLLRAAV
ncbi:MAG TPA: hypothetical protein VN633_22255 [Bryobacteraceae bacterium]|nr:hypothetical protein [Bryobacteraceae bacterium]